MADDELLLDEAKVERDAANAALAVAERCVKRMDLDGPGTVRLRSGIVLRVKPVPLDAMGQAAGHLIRPEPPITHNESKGRDEANPADAGYVRALAEYEEASARSQGNVALLMGTECASVPDGMFPPEDDGWAEVLDAAGVTVDISTAARRYASWLKLYAFRGTIDAEAAMFAVFTQTSLAEEEVGRAVLAFRDRAGRPADNGRGTAPAAQDGDHVRPGGSRRGARVRGAGGRKVRGR
jgi:hypothetical protein